MTLGLLALPSLESMEAGTDLCTTVLVCLRALTQRRVGIVDCGIQLSALECNLVTSSVSCLEQVSLSRTMIGVPQACAFNEKL